MPNVNHNSEGSKHLIQREGIVEETLPNTNFRVNFSDENGQAQVLCYLSGNMRRHYIKLVPGDKVSVEFSPSDLTKGRIIRRN